MVTSVGARRFFARTFGSKPGFWSITRYDFVVLFGEAIGTMLFLFFGLGGVKTAQYITPFSERGGPSGLTPASVFLLSSSMGFSLMATVWTFYRITGGMFNPAVSLSLFLVGGMTPFRLLMAWIGQIAGGIAGAALVAALTPLGAELAITSLAPGMNVAQGLFFEMFMTAMLCFTVLFTAVEKSRATPFAAVPIGVVLFICQLFGTQWTGCGMNPARAFAPSVVSGSFHGYHWIYWIGPLLGALLAPAVYGIFKWVDYLEIVPGQDATDPHPAIIEDAIHNKTRGRHQSDETAV